MKMLINLILFSICTQISSFNWPNLPFLYRKKTAQQGVQNSKQTINIATFQLYDSTNLLNFVMNLYKADKQSNINAIIICVNNSGGNPGDFNLIHNTILNIKTRKPVIVIVEDFAYSGGYFAICSASHIISSETAEVGAIGMYTLLEKHRNAQLTGKVNSAYKADIDYELFRAGKYKMIANPHYTLTDDDKEYIQDSLNKAYKTFYEIVAKSRNLKLDEKELWAEGKTFIGINALKLGLIDSIGGIYEAIEKAKELITDQNPDMAYNKEVELINFMPESK